MVNLKNLSEMNEGITGGHRLCGGCGIPIIVRQVLHGTDKPVIVANATGCCEVTTTIFPETCWNVPYIHSAFPNLGSTMTGVVRMYEALKKRGKINKEIKFLAIGGDGGTFDIGLQALSGALERKEKFVYLCYNNESYTNTGYQRSGATQRGTWTTTTPVGKVTKGKTIKRKNLTEIVAAHDVPYVAQSTPGYWNDLIEKARKAFATDGPAFLNALSPCVPGWNYDSNITQIVSKLAVETRYWPLYEIENGRYKLNVIPKQKPLEEFLKLQGRFKHLLKPENKEMLDALKKDVFEEFERLQAKVSVRERHFGQG